MKLAFAALLLALALSAEYSFDKNAAGGPQSVWTIPQDFKYPGKGGFLIWYGQPMHKNGDAYDGMKPVKGDQGFWVEYNWDGSESTDSTDWFDNAYTMTPLVFDSEKGWHEDPMSCTGGALACAPQKLELVVEFEWIMDGEKKVLACKTCKARFTIDWDATKAQVPGCLGEEYTAGQEACFHTLWTQEVNNEFKVEPNNCNTVYKHDEITMTFVNGGMTPVGYKGFQAEQPFKLDVKDSPDRVNIDYYVSYFGSNTEDWTPGSGKETEFFLKLTNTDSVGIWGKITLVDDADKSILVSAQSVN